MGCGVVERHLEMAQPTKKKKKKNKTNPRGPRWQRSVVKSHHFLKAQISKYFKTDYIGGMRL